MKYTYAIQYLALLLAISLGSIDFLSAQQGFSEAANPQILFLTFKIEKAPAIEAGETIRLTNSQKVAGQLKRNLKVPGNVHPGALLCEFLDRQGAVLAAETMEDPLAASVEYLGEDGSLKQVLLEKQEADLFLRVQHDPLFHQLRISKTMPGGETVMVANFLDF